MPSQHHYLKLRLSSLALGVALCAAWPYAATAQMTDMQAGVEAWHRGDDSAAVRAWMPAAERGHADAQFNMGQAFKLGRGVAQDIAMAEVWYRRAAQQGHVQAEDNLGLILFASGQRVAAMHYIRKSAARGEARALFLLGTAHYNGDLAENDWPRAYALITRASQTGLSLALSRVAELDILIPEDQRRQGLAMMPDLLREEAAARAASQTQQGKPAPAAPPAARPQIAPNAPIQMVNIAPSAMNANLDAAALIEPEIMLAPRPKPGVTFSAPPLPVAIHSAAAAIPAVPVVAEAAVPAPVVDQAAPAPARIAPTAPPSSPQLIDLPPSSSPPSSPTITPVQDAIQAVITPSSAPTPRAAPVTAAPASTKPTAQITKPKAVTPAPLRTGPWRLQLGMFSQPANAQRMWSQLSARYPEIARRKPIITTGTRFTSLHAGEFSSRNEAVNLCNALKNRDDSCLVLD